MSDLIAANLEITAVEFDTPAIDAIGLDAKNFTIAPQPYAAISIPQIELTTPELWIVQPLPATIPAAATGAKRGHAVLVSELLWVRFAAANLVDKPDQVFCHAIAGVAPRRRVPLRAAFAVSHIVDHADHAKAFAITYVADWLRRAA